MNLAVTSTTSLVNFNSTQIDTLQHLLRLLVKCTQVNQAMLLVLDKKLKTAEEICKTGDKTLSLNWLITTYGYTALSKKQKLDPSLAKEPLKNCRQIEILPASSFDINTYVLVCCFQQPQLSEEDKFELEATLATLSREIQGFNQANRQIQYRQLVEHLGDMIFELDENGNFTYVNPALVAITEYSEKELFEKRHIDIIDPVNLKAATDLFMGNIKEQQQNLYFECRIRSKSGKKIDVGLNLQFQYEGSWVKKTYAVARDITNLKQAQAQLAESEEKYRLISENSQDLITIHELDGSFSYVSSSVTSLLGYTPEEFISFKNPYDLIHKDNIIKVFEGKERERLIETGYFNHEFQIKHKNGNYVWFETYTKPAIDSNGDIIGFQSFSKDISLTKRHEEQLLQADEELNKYKEGLKLLNEITSNTALTQDQQINQALWASTEFLGMSTGVLSQIIDQDYEIKYIYGEGAGFRQGQHYELEETFSEVIYRKNDLVAVEEVSKTTYKIHPCHQKFKIESYIGMPYYVSGKKRGTINFSSSDKRTDRFNDNDFEYIKLLARWIGFILQHQEYEQNLMQDKIILQAFVSNAPAAIAMFDKEMRYITASDKWYDDYGLADEYIIGRSYFELFPDIGQDWEAIFKRAMTGNIESNEQDLIEKADGTIQWIKWEVRPWYTALDTVGGLIMFTEDISQQKEQQLQLKIAKRKAEQASKAKEQFLSTMSHEIRTPLNAIIGMTEVMLMDDQTAEQRKRLELLKFSGENLLVLINDILDFNKIEAGKLEFEIADFNLKQLLGKIRESMMSIVNKKRLEFKINYDPDLPEFVKGDSVRIAQIITNLVNNAIKFTEEGHISLKARCIHKDEKHCTIKFEVKDTGIGIPKNKLETIFQSFEQANAAITRKYGGSGLGLAITKKLLAMLGSNIQVHSKEQVGSTFFFEIELPIGEVQSDQKDILHQTDIREDIHLLVAEDNPGNRVLIESLFGKWEISFDFAFDGKQAFEKVQSKRYDMVFMDLQMPEMDGYEATRSIRSLDDTYFKEIPIVALTASVMSNVLEKTKEVGMNGYVSKPFNPVHLKQTIADFTSGIKNEKEVLESLNSDDFPYLTSLIGDDPNTLKEIIKTTIESVQNASNGIKDGLEADDINKVRSELHVLRPNLHNLELAGLTADLPKVRELTEENRLLLQELNQSIEKELNKPRITKYLA